MEFFHCYRLPLQIYTDTSSDAGFWYIRGRDAHRTDQTHIQVVKHMPFVSVHVHTATFATMTHLGVFVTFAPIFCHTFDHACFPMLIDLYILLFHLASDFQRWFGQFHL